ncbi:MAG: efflux RND transporter permease subunit [Treponema sp.]|nr:efflux RND transporter permease subunit [Treponema sp.]MCL2272367.1 efflux RND transporter permease subunit [Treponema sp.]
MKSLINLFIRRPVTVIMILASVIMAASISLVSLPVNRLPDFSVPRVTVETIYPGMAANEIRTLVTIPLEDGFSPVKSLERIRSVSRDNRSVISLDFRWGTDPMAASVLVREAIDSVYPSLPEGARKPAVTAGDSENEPHAVIAVCSHNGEFARKLAEYELRARLRRIDGAGSVILCGGETAEEQIALDVQRLVALGLSPSQFANLLSQETSDIPAGNAQEGNMELVVVASGKPESASSLAKIILPVSNGTLSVEDAGKVSRESARRESIFVYDGKEAAALEIYRRPGSDPLRLSREIKKTIEEAAVLFSRDAQIEIVFDSAPSLLSGTRSLVVSAVLGAIAVFVVLLIFIRRLKYSLLASMSIPFSAAAGICALSMTGKSLNSMSLCGLAIGIALVSDVSVIVLDLLHRSFRKKETVPQIQEIGSRAASIAGSSIASTVTTALVFVPIVFLPGPLGSLFGDLSAALVTSVFAGWFYAQFCLPSMYRLLFGVSITFIPLIPKSDIKRFFQKFQFLNGFYSEKIKISKEILRKINSFFIKQQAGLLNTFNFRKNKIKNGGSLEKKYVSFLVFLLRRPEKTFLTASILVIFGSFSLMTRPAAFINPDEAEDVRVSIVFPPGTLLETAESTGVYITEILSKLPSVKTVYGRAGAEEEDAGRRADIDYIREELSLRCVLKKNSKPEKALAEINKALASAQDLEMPFSAYYPKDRTEALLGLSAENAFVIKAKDRSELLQRAEIAQNTLKETAVKFRPRGQRPQLRFFPNREAAAYLSMPAAQIAETLYILNEGVIASTLEIEGRPIDVRVTAEKTANEDLVQKLENIPLRTSLGKTVYLGSLGTIEKKEEEASLARLDRSDVVYADFLPAKKNSSKIRETAARFSWFTAADESVFNRYRNSLILYVILVLILLYMTVGAQFESFLLPLILMMTIPFSLAGAGPALLISGMKIDSSAVLGLTALFGLVLNNSLVLFEICDEKIRNGLSPCAAVIRGASERMRAIIITLSTSIFALLPLVISPMGNSQKSMAVTMLGGLAASTLISLFAIPPVLIKFFKHKLGEAQ